MSKHRVFPASSAASRGRSRSHALSALLRMACVAAPLALGACASTGSTTPSASVLPSLFDDARFAASTEPIDSADVFRMTPDMEAYLKDQVLPTARARGMRAGLTDALYTRSKLQLEYEASITRNAAQAFEARQGNCLSLVIMTGAFAKAMGLAVTFQEVTTDAMWSRTGDFYFMSGHVNLQLERAFVDTVGKYDRYSIYTIDFMPQPETLGLHVHPIGESTVLAMYMNNRAAEALVVGQLDNAYWRAREALELDPMFLSAYNTLGVIYMRHGDSDDAEKVLRYATGAGPDNARVMANYAQVLRTLHRDAEAEVVQARLDVLEPFPPFYWFNRGQAAMKAGDQRAAREFFKKELEREPDYHEFHYALAIADVGLGRVDEARSELALAMSDSVKRTDHDLYSAKLDKLKGFRHANLPPPSSVQ